MCSLEYLSIAKTREILSKSDAHSLLSHWKRASDLRGGNEHYEFDQQLRKDVIGYTIMRFVQMMNGEVFGGFVRSHYSGLPWSDIDIVVASVSRETFEFALTEFICIILGFSKHHVRLTLKKRNTYGYSYHLKLGPFKFGHSKTISECIEIFIDVCQTIGPLKNNNNATMHRIPVTVGSCLRMDKDSTGFVPIFKNYINTFSVHDILDLLKQGTDIKLFRSMSHLSTSSRQLYREYYWERITKMERSSWKLLDSDEPEYEYLPLP